MDALLTMEKDISERVSHIETELAVIEASQKRTEGMRKMLWGIGVAVFVQLIGAAVGYGKLQAQLDDIGSFRQDTSTVLAVLGDHGTELSNLNLELTRIRALDDNLAKHLNELQKQINNRTHDRYYRQDAVRERGEDREWTLLTIDAKINKHHEKHKAGEFR